MFELTTWPRSPWSIFDELESLEDSMSRALEGRTGHSGDRQYRYPLLNVWTSSDSLVVDAELPGVNADEVEINVVGDELTRSGKINSSPKREGETLYRQEERPSGEFSRTFQLPFRANTDGVRAAFKDGILRINIPRSEAEKPKRIMIEAA